MTKSCWNPFSIQFPPSLSSYHNSPLICNKCTSRISCIFLLDWSCSSKLFYLDFFWDVEGGRTTTPYYFVRSINPLCQHSSEIRGSCLIKWPREALLRKLFLNCKKAWCGFISFFNFIFLLWMPRSMSTKTRALHL